MRPRLDLDSLLKKYQNKLAPYNNTKKLISTHGGSQQKFGKLKTQGNQYFGQTVLPINTKQTFKKEAVLTRVKSVNSDFHMSKSQCENFLLSIKADLQRQHVKMSNTLTQSHDSMIQSFQRQHQALRNQLIAMIQASLNTSKQTALAYLKQSASQQPSHYKVVENKIAGLDSEISNLLAGLGSNIYRQVIAEVVTRDFSQVIKEIQAETDNFRKNYQESLQPVIVDSQKVQDAQGALQRIYTWKKYDPAPLASLKISNYQPDLGITRRSSKKKIFDQPGKLAMTDRFMTQDLTKKTKRSFFNFDQND